MKTMLDDLERDLTDLLQMGLATAGPDMAARFAALSDRAEELGAHTCAEISARITAALEERSHTMEKTDQKLAAEIFRAAHYITLARQRLTEEDIRARWSQEGGSL